MEVHKHTTQIKEHVYNYIYTNTYKRQGHPLNLCQGDYQQQQQDGGDNVVGLLHIKCSASGKHYPFTLTVCEHHVSMSSPGTWSAHRV